jgi:2-desacetyl-2-hydroxyethyl bacteriochlorophyllide A dehydrogenase
MKAVVLRGPEKLSYQDVPKPVAAPGEVLLQVKACGICGSDVRYYYGENPWALHTLGHNLPNPDNMILGHEFTGDVVAVGDPADRDLLGQRVAVLAFNTCGRCEFCRTGRENLCRQTRHLGHSAGWHDMAYFPGGMADYCQVWATHVFPFADHLAYEEAATLDFFAVAMHAATLAPNLLGEDVLVIGSGPVGLAITQIVQAMGAKRVFCTDVQDTALAIAIRLGAAAAIKASQGETVDLVMARTEGRGVRAVFDTVGLASTQQMALAALGASGTLVNLVSNEQTVAYRLLDLNGEKSIRCSANNLISDFGMVLQLMEMGKIDAKPLITHRFPLSQVQAAFDLLTGPDRSACKVILEPGK